MIHSYTCLLFHVTLTANLDTLESCLKSSHSGHCHNGVGLNGNKSDATLFDTTSCFRNISHLTGVNVVGSVISFRDKTVNFGITLES